VKIGPIAQLTGLLYWFLNKSSGLLKWGFLYFKITKKIILIYTLERVKTSKE